MRRACQAQSQTGRYQSHHHVKVYALDYQWLLIEFAEETIDWRAWPSHTAGSPSTNG